MRKTPEFIQVEKLDLREGEELQEFISSVWKALTRHRERTNRSLMLRGIFEDHVVTKDVENGRLFKMQFKRDKGGFIEFGETQEVRQTFVPVKRTEKNSDAAEVFKAVELPAGLTVILEDGEPTQASLASVAEVAKACEERSAPEYVALKPAGFWDGCF